MANRRVATNTYKEHNVPTPNLTQPTRLTPQPLNERREKGLYFNCDNKNNDCHKCGEKKVD